ncbi:prepilin peptidase [Galbitalea sp. SE-J8]|uniref:prepilin peptidase n=1 Tax=Galbitalea sp. SE-J8 TaxID=3054952 RepID=UPI00259C784A|nr:A24 family peptidase [Galbitalea sp. SE-J8]MDM4761522.1 prepilin peptidase [Galbitalea sp. SE-J8]
MELPAAGAAIAALFGLLIGSFLNVVVWRVPRGESIAHPPSHCPRCGHRIRWYDNVPVISWLVLRAKCRDCGNPISARYPAVELGTGVAFALVGLWWALVRLPQHLSVVAALVELVAYLYLAAITIALALIDLDVFRLPNAIVYPAYVVGAVLLGLVALLDGDGWGALRALIGCVALFLFYLIVVLVYPSGMGLGDVKLAGVLGLFTAWIGWGGLTVGAFAAFLLGGVFGVVLLIAQRAGRKTRIPFGPWMLAGAWVGIVAGEPIAGAYLRAFGLA